MAGKIKALLAWCQNNTRGYRDVNVVNMTTSWKDGLAFCALIHHFRPDLIDFDSLLKENVLHNNRLAFQTAEDELGIAALLDAEDMVAMKVPDKLSIITYVSQYYNCLHTMQPVAKSPNDKAPKRSASPVKVVLVEAKKKPLEVQTADSSPPSQPAEKAQVFSTCEICKKRVHLVERFIEEGKVYHRQCHRTKSLSGMYRRGDDKSKLYGSTPLVGDKSTVNIAANGVTPSPRSSSSISAPVSAESSSSAEVVKSSSRVHAMANVFEKNAKAQRGLKGNGDSPHSLEKSSSPTSLNNQNKPDNEDEAMAAVEGPVAVKEQKEVKQPVVVHPSDASKNSDISDGKARMSHSEVGENDRNSISSQKQSEKPSASNSDSVLPGLLKSLSDIKRNKDEKEKSSSAQKVDSASDEERKDAFPSLLESLTEGKRKETTTGNKVLTDSSSDGSPTSAFAPLISELPKIPEAKSRSRTTSSESPAANKPIPRKRSHGSGSDSSKRSSATYDSELNPFESAGHTPASIPVEKDRKPSTKSKRKPYNQSLNPFAFEEPVEKSSDISTNPFEEDLTVEQSSLSVAPKGNSKIRRGTVNIVNPNDARLNPFTDEYEGRKQSPNPPKPPARHKAHAPTPPKTQQAPSASTNAKASPSKVAKSAAPNWKVDVEKKMEQMNRVNQTDTKYVEKAKETPPSKIENRRSVPLPAHIHSKVSASDRKQMKTIKPSRPAPGFGFPLVKRKVKSQMTEEEITNEMTVLDLQLKDLEKKGVKLEEVLRDEMEIDTDPKQDTDKLLGDWFELVQEKNKLVRRETDLVFLMQQQRLEQEYADVEFMIRKLMNKPDNEKSDEEKEEESKLLEKLVAIVERRNTIINSIEEARLKEEEEDAAYDKLRSMPKDLTLDSDSSNRKSKKSKNKIKKVFGKKKKNSKSSLPNPEDAPSSS